MRDDYLLVTTESVRQNREWLKKRVAQNQKKSELQTIRISLENGKNLFESLEEAKKKRVIMLIFW